MIDVLDNLIGSASDLPDPTKTITKNIDQINSDLTDVHRNVVGTMVALSSYRYVEHPYTFPHDGYVKIRYENSAVTATFLDANGTEIGSASVRGLYESDIVYVRAGMKVYIPTFADGNIASYIPFN
jgi:hypothetical protein